MTPAFPQLNIERDGQGGYTKWTEPGMTLRDYFAAAALQGWASSGQLKIDLGENGPFGNMANWCYQVADAMLQARKEN